MAYVDKSVYNPRSENGKYGEQIAAEFLEKTGYKILEQNWFFSHKELDLIAEDEHYLIFVEVKTRSTIYVGASAYGSPARAVDRRKMLNTVAAAEAYLRENPTTKQPRLDVIEVYLGQVDMTNRIANPPVLSINHICDAFDAKGKRR